MAGNVETPCRFYRFVRDDVSHGIDDVGTRCLTLPSDVTEPPIDADHVHDLLTQFSELGHGDIVSFGKYRAESAYIVHKNDSGRFSWGKNPDDSGSGYLTIPTETAEKFSNCVEKYAQIITEHAIDLHLSTKDEFLREKFQNHEIPEQWKFNIFFNKGAVVEFFVKFPEKKWREFNWESVTFDDLKDSSLEFTEIKFNVRVKLEGDYLIRYKEKYTTEGRMSWLLAVPQLSKLWEITKGPSNAGPGNMAWIWKFSGPDSEEDRAKESIELFLQGFPHYFLPPEDCSL